MLLRIKPSQIFNRVTTSSGGMKYVQRVMQRVASLKKKGIDILDCGLGESSHGLLPPVTRAGERALHAEEFYYVKPIQGLPGLREKIAELISRETGKKTTPEEVIVTPGAELALDLVYRTFLNPGSQVIIFDPFYIPFVACALIYKAKPIIIETYSTDFLPNINLLKRMVNRKTRLIVINSPNNPTGRVYPKKIVKEIALFAKKRRILLLSDETYRFFDYEGLFMSPRTYYPAGTIVIRSFSKEFSMMGYRVGYIVAPRKITQYILPLQFPTWGAPRISSLMAEAALGVRMPQKVLNSYKRKRDKLCKGLEDTGLLSYKPEGAFYFYLKSQNNNGLNYTLALARKGLLVIPAFSQRNTHVRLSYGTLMDGQIDEVIRILKGTQ